MQVSFLHFFWRGGGGGPPPPPQECKFFFFPLFPSFFFFFFFATLCNLVLWCCFLVGERKNVDYLSIIKPCSMKFDTYFQNTLKGLFTIFFKIDMCFESVIVELWYVTTKTLPKHTPICIQCSYTYTYILSSPWLSRIWKIREQFL